VGLVSEQQLRDALISVQSEVARLTEYARALTNELDRTGARLLADLKQHDTGSRRLPQQDEDPWGRHDDPEHN
jgi:hypothetical protein